MSIKETAESALPGWTMVEPATDVAQDAPETPTSDFVGKDLETVNRKYGTATEAPAEAAAARRTTAEPAGESRIVRMKADQDHDDPVLGTRAMVLVNGKVVGIQG